MLMHFDEAKTFRVCITTTLCVHQLLEVAYVLKQRHQEVIDYVFDKTKRQSTIIKIYDKTGKIIIRMILEMKVPSPGESITEVEIAHG